ncbi:FAD-dependent oxidoreductase [Glaciihabitans sp. INWT7]|uniref:NAD(P)/FAD-dependent oxidoreductase n=1 Tax=Glaciihabitans sp. INWT7 TaxID=2596912 RepID=UPI00162610AA|nr:FAD-binding oxidoreductase [Glaciihabitans sp. INWT7]QNE46438.1 FAD-dependent oxidoreductase [Glaciihabitans sp. INWT7]
MADFRALSFWFDSLSSAGSGEAGTDELRPRPALPGDLGVDVAIVGGGLTGLWTAYYLASAEPSLTIAVLEKHIAGFGASGRNGGWCSALFPASTASLARRHGRAAALAMRKAMIDTVDEVGRVTSAEGIDCDFVKGGTVSLARGAAQLVAARNEVAEAAMWGVDDLQLRDAAHSPRGATGALGSTFDPACARLQPAKLVRGLAKVVEGLGVRIYEGTEVLSWRSGRVTTDHGTVDAATIVIALEGYAASLAQTHRQVLPLYSLMIATEPLSDELWDEIGIEHGQTFADFRHLLVYGQRTADNRFAFGGRGARYHWGSSIRSEYDRVPGVFDHLERTLGDIFPVARQAAITHRWGGPLGVPRDWHAGAGLDPATGIAMAGGYVGDGLSTTNLAGRTLTDLILNCDTPISRLPWVNHHSPRWEPEPFRFIGANLGTTAMNIADAEERMTGRASLAARLMAPLTGH